MPGRQLPQRLRRRGDLVRLPLPAYPVSAPSTLVVPAQSDGPAYRVTWQASGTEGVTYELQEATDAGFVTA